MPPDPSPAPRCPECGRPAHDRDPAPVRPLSPAALLPWVYLLAAAAWLLWPSFTCPRPHAFDYLPDTFDFFPLPESGGVTYDDLVALAKSDAPPSSSLVRQLIAFADRWKDSRIGDRRLLFDWENAGAHVQRAQTAGWPVPLIAVHHDTYSGARWVNQDFRHDWDTADSAYTDSTWSFASFFTSTSLHPSSRSVNVLWIALAIWVLLALAAGRLVHVIARSRGRSSAAADRLARTARVSVAVACAIATIVSVRVALDVRPDQGFRPSDAALGPSESDLRAWFTAPDADNRLARCLLNIAQDRPRSTNRPRLAVMFASDHAAHREWIDIKGRPWPLVSYSRTARSAWPLPRPDFRATKGSLFAAAPSPPPPDQLVPYPQAGIHIELFRNGYLNPRIDLPTRAGDTHLRSIELNIALICGYIVFLLVAFHGPRWFIRCLRRRAARRRYRRGLCAACAYPRPAPAVAAPGC